jgi:hypothetical protein
MACLSKTITRKEERRADNDYIVYLKWPRPRKSVIALVLKIWLEAEGNKKHV